MSCMLGGREAGVGADEFAGGFYTAVLRTYDGGMRRESMMMDMRLDFQCYQIDCSRRYCDTPKCRTSLCFQLTVRLVVAMLGGLCHASSARPELLVKGSATHSPKLVCFKDPFPGFRMIRGLKIAKRNIS